MTTAKTVLPNKRDRLVEAAKLAFYHHGFSTTTLADVAALTAVPLGNVYYCFRTKDDLLAAVIDAHLRELRARFARWDQDPHPRHRLRSWLQAQREGQNELARYGCPYGSLGQEVGKKKTPATALVAQWLEAHIEWAAKQAALLAKPQTAPHHLP